MNALEPNRLQVSELVIVFQEEKDWQVSTKAN